MQPVVFIRQIVLSAITVVGFPAAAAGLSAAMAGVGTMAAAAPSLAQTGAAVAATGGATMAVAPPVLSAGGLQAAMTGTGEMSAAAPSLDQALSVAMAGAGGMTAGAPVANAGGLAAQMTGAGAMSVAAPALDQSLAAALAGEAAMSAPAPALDQALSVAMAGAGGMTAAAPALDQTLSVAFSGGGAIVAAQPSLDQSMAVSFAGAGAMAVGAPEVGASGDEFAYGNTAIDGAAEATVAPQSRRLAFVGDSRVQNINSGSFSGEVAQRCGDWCWIVPGATNYSVGGSTIEEAITQIASAYAAGARVFVVLTGVNGALISGSDTLANRQAQIQLLVDEVDFSDVTIVLCNDMPTGSTPTVHQDWHDWLDSTGPSAVNAAIVPANTWDAVDINGNNLLDEADYANDGLHPAGIGMERQARAVWQAMNAHFTSTCLDLDDASRAILVDGTSTTSVNRGTVPSGWVDFNAADDLVYTTSGTGEDTVLTMTNGGASDILAGLRRNSFGPKTDAVLFLEWGIAPDPGSSTTTGSTARNLSGAISLIDTDLGSNVQIFNTTANAFTAQAYRMGGRWRAAIEMGGALAGADLYVRFEVPAGGAVNLYRADIHER